MSTIEKMEKHLEFYRNVKFIFEKSEYVKVEQNDDEILVLFTPDDSDKSMQYEMNYNNLFLIPDHIVIYDERAIIYDSTGENYLIMIDNSILEMKETIVNRDNDVYFAYYDLIEHEVPAYIRLDSENPIYLMDDFPKFYIDQKINKNGLYKLSLSARLHYKNLIPLHFIDIVTDDINYGLTEIQSEIYKIKNFECSDVLGNIAWCIFLNSDTDISVFNVTRFWDCIKGFETKRFASMNIYYDYIVDAYNSGKIIIADEDAIIIDTRFNKNLVLSISCDIDDNTTDKMANLCDEMVKCMLNPDSCDMKKRSDIVKKYEDLFSGKDYSYIYHITSSDVNEISILYEDMCLTIEDTDD